MKYWLNILGKSWLILSVVAFIAAQVVFTGQVSSEVAGNLILFMLVVSLPGSIVGYVLMFWLVSVFEPYGLYAHNSRFVLALFWGVYFVCGAIQWFALPNFLGKNRVPSFSADEMTDGASR